MNIRIILLTAICFMQIALLSLVQAATKEKEEDIRTLIVLMGNDNIAEEMAEIMVTGVMNQMEQKYPRMTKEAEHAASRAIYNVIKEESSYITDRLAPLYDRHFTHTEIKELIEFYASPVGQKFSANYQGLMLETMQIGQQWARDIQPKIQNSLEKELKGVIIER